MSRNYPEYKEGEGFPGYTCISVNEEVVHGIPRNRVLKEGDVVTLDLAMSLDGYCADTAITVGLGKTAPIGQEIAGHHTADAGSGPCSICGPVSGGRISPG